MTLFASILIDGMAYAMILFMITVGLSITLGLMHVVNMAHGAFAMLGGFAAVELMSRLGLRFEPALVIAVLATALVSVPIERVVISRIYGRPELDQALLTIGLAFVAIALVNLWLGASFSSIDLPARLSGPVDLGFRSFPRHRVAVIVLGCAISVALWLFIGRSRFGIRLRAAVDNPGIAESVGINTTLLYSMTFAIGAGLAALGGIAGAELLPMEANYPIKYMVLFLAVVAVGGQGTLFGTFLAALLLGVVDTASKYLLPDLASISFYLTMLVALALRPQGLLGRKDAA
ncbi:MAG: branched-chain amino acid ABC transporter permease [Xanthobacteraceae bacterium]|nr:branched-chain amino acid ABC transporter permease [Xanthobacteraceae bacterium]